MMGTPKDDLLERLEDPEYAKLYGEENAKVDFAITLTKARRSLNLTQRSLADKLGISQPYVAKLEGGEANPTLGTIGRLLATINLRLVTGTAPLKPEQVRPFYGFALTGAADGSDPLQYLRTYHTGEEIQRRVYITSAYPNDVWGVAGSVPIWPARREREVALIGGAAK